MNIFADGFTAMPISSMIEVNDCQGATGGLLEPSEIAEHYCGIETFSVGDIMAYGFRRFGYPVNGWNSYKQLCRWIITTPMDGVFLTVQPRDVEPFGYLLKNPLTEKLVAEQTAPAREWGQRCHDWAKKEHGVVLVYPLSWAGQCSDEEFETASEEWLQKKYPKDYTKNINTLEQLAEKAGVSKEDVIKLFQDEKREECEKFVDEYKKDHPIPQKSYSCMYSENIPEKPFWENLPEESLERQINAALYRAILDLTRPVWVRDWEIAIDNNFLKEEFVKYDEDGEEIYNYYAPRSGMAGYGVDQEAILKDDSIK